MKIQNRIVDIKRHTLGYKVAGRNRTRRETVQLAKLGLIDGVTVRRGGRDRTHIVSTPGSPNLYHLPTRVVA